MKKAFSSLLVAVVLSGCASAGRKIDQTSVDKLQKGVSTQADVRSAIGSPEQITKDSDGNETWVYIYTRSQVKGTTFIPIVGAFAGGVDTQSQSTVIKFGPDKVVKSIESSYGGTSVDNGIEAGGKANLETDKGKRPK